MSEPVKMKRGLKNRHLQMIALGGAIGTGLFYGSASTIALAGPAVILSYLLGGIVIFFIMRMLGEMAVDEPVSGSFSHYATKYWGRFAGFVSGWNYWFNYVLVSMAELTAVGIYVHYWLPDVPQWLSALVCLVVITAVNLINVRAYGEFEFWMALIKITAIVLMIVLGLYLLGIAPQPFPENFSNLWANGGFLPNGWWGMGLATAVVMFSFGGIELIGITAGEAENPDRTIPRAINQVIWRILIFYVGTMIVLMALWPWNKVGMEASPFVQIFENVGIPAAAHILNFVVLTAAISVYNSAIYSNSRMLYGLAKKGEAPQIFTRLSARGVPVIGILVSSGCTLVVVALNYFLEGHVFMYLMTIATCAAVISWVVICITHLKFRALCAAQHKDTRFKALLYPVANYLCLAFLAGVIFFMAQIPDMQLAVIFLPIWLIVLAIGYQLYKKNQPQA
ncbi:MAG: amino acid permease [Selenomonas sp.]|nr:amino acid permease [Selenomonas sp.]MCI7330238.1 amino acid permease [Selenomonadaceae bacterium]MDD7056279.1 amino acid permease [Selenomonadaceae bacterium]MDY3916359.1 amino acid permease [Selenomonadaceae bacterium]